MKNNLKIIIPAMIVSLGLVSWFILSRTPKETKITSSIVKKAEKIKKEKNQSQPISAQKAYQIAQSYAKKWAQDAVLVDVSNFISDSNNGLADLWTFIFRSPQKGESDGYEVWIADGELSREETTPTRFLEPVENNWLDSDVIAQKSQEHFQGLTCKNYWYGLSGNTWTVKCDKEGGGKPKWVELNAVTGEFIKTWEGH